MGVCKGKQEGMLVTSKFYQVEIDRSFHVPRNDRQMHQKILQSIF